MTILQGWTFNELGITFNQGGLSFNGVDFAQVANAIRPIRQQPGSIYRAAQALGVDPETFQFWMNEARQRGYDTGEPREGYEKGQKPRGRY